MSSIAEEYHHHHHGGHQTSLNRLAFSATFHCLSGCAVGEVLGMVIGTALGWGNLATIALAIGLAFARNRGCCGLSSPSGQDTNRCGQPQGCRIAISSQHSARLVAHK